MNWQIVLGLNLITIAITQILIKLIVKKLPRAQALSIQFFICAGLASLYGLATDNFCFSNDMFLIGIVGFFNASGAYCQWQAIKLSMSRTSLFLPLSNVLTIALATLFLAEAAEWNLRLVIGICLCFLAIFFFHNHSKALEKNNVKKWLLSISGMVIIFGTAEFLMKIFSSSVPNEQFLIYWYIGAFLGSLPIVYFEKQNLFKFPGKSVFLIPFASLAILGSLATLYWAFELTSISRIVPIRSVGIAFLPVLIGWFIFQERRGLSKREILAFAVGITGASLIILA